MHTAVYGDTGHYNLLLYIILLINRVLKNKINVIKIKSRRKKMKLPHMLTLYANIKTVCICTLYRHI